jgi:hypothetical protein
MFHTPERSGGLWACAVAAAKKAEPSVNSKTVTLYRIWVLRFGYSISTLSGWPFNTTFVMRIELPPSFA